ncbi:Cytosolic seryl-tRNA synthetase, partial [Serendipita sp. 398]
MTIDIHLFVKEKGGDPEAIRESEKKRYRNPEVVDEVIALYSAWVKESFKLDQINKSINAVQKDITAKKKAKEDASEFMEKKLALDEEKKEQINVVKESEVKMKIVASTVGNLLYKDVPVSDNEDNNTIIRKWGPQSQASETPDPIPNCLPHNEILMKLGA